MCTHWLKGSCAYGDKCRYDHQRPEWAPREERTVPGYVAPKLPKPAADDLSEMPPISDLRLGGAVAAKKQQLMPTPILKTSTAYKPSPSLSPADVSEQNSSSAASSAETAIEAALHDQARRSPPPVELPSDPFGAGGGGGGASGATGGGGSCTSIEDGLPDDLDLVSDALEQTMLHVDTELLLAAAAAEEEAAAAAVAAALEHQQHWATSGSIGSGGGGGGGYYGSEGIEAQKLSYDEAVYEAGVYEESAAGLATTEGYEGVEAYEYAEHEGMYYVEGDDGTGYYEEGAAAAAGAVGAYDDNSGWHHHPGSAYGSYGTGGHSSGGEYGAFGSAGTSPGMSARFGGAGAGSHLHAWHIPGGSGAGSDGGWGTGAGGSTGDFSRFYASPALQSLCWEYYNHGVCSANSNNETGEQGASGGSGGCQLAHGDWCETCNHYALHPVDMNAREAHLVECHARHERLEAIRRSAHVECGICMERVTEKSIPSERRFGLLSCEHPFCLSCIRNWRQQYSTGVDVEQALRTCPICRTAAHFITPTSVWPATPEEREAIISGYKTKLKEIDCRHFNYGEGACPFGTSCMYKHADREGRLEESAPRRVAADEGEVRVVQPVRLSDFIVVQRGKVRGRRR